jgi:hypothetical protein
LNGDVQVHPTAYTSFDPENQALGYLGDSGPSSTADFSFILPGNTNFFMIFQQVFPGSDGIGCAFGFRVDFGFCGLPADTDPPEFDSIGEESNIAYGDNTDRFLHEFWVSPDRAEQDMLSLSNQGTRWAGRRCCIPKRDLYKRKTYPIYAVFQESPQFREGWGPRLF